MPRIDGRKNDELRPIEIIPDINKFAEGSCLIRCGNTHVLCTASVEERTPPHVPEGEGWVTAEYAMLPRANRERSRRDIAKLKLSPRSAEIQRLIGRSLRACVDLAGLGERTITVDCDVLQGDGGTRTASVTGGFVALALALWKLVQDGVLPEMPLLVPLWRLHSCILWCFRLYIFLIFIFMHHFFSCLRSAILMSRSATLSCSVISTLESGFVLYRILVLPPLMSLESSTTLKLKVRINHTIKVNFICD